MTPLIAPLLSAALVLAPTGTTLRVEPLDPEPAPAGGTTTVHGFVANTGPITAGAFTVVVQLPTGATAEGDRFPEGCTVDATATVVRCPFPAGLQEGRSATALVPVRIAGTARGVLRGGLVTVESAGNRDRVENDGPFTIQVTGGRP